MSKKKYTALILGSNGLIGTKVVNSLLNNESYSCVYTISRKPLAIVHPNLIQIIADYTNILSHISSIDIDHFYCCIGTTKRKTPDVNEYFKIDHDYPILVAKYLKNKGCSRMALISSIGANILSNQFYLKLKGQVEQSVITLNFDSTYILRPSLLLGKRKENRFLESVAQKLSPILNIICIGKLKNYQSIKAESVATAMVKLMLSNKLGIHIYQTQEIKENA